MLMGLLRGYLIVLIVVSLLMLPLCLTLPVDDAMQLGRRAFVLMGVYWCVAAPIITGLCALFVYLRRHFRGTTAYPPAQVNTFDQSTGY